MKKIFLILFILVQAACSKSDEAFEPTLPPITQTGENTFGCYADGILIIPRDGTGTFNARDAGMIYWNRTGGFYDVDVHDFASEKTSSINLHIGGLDSLGVGEYIVNESNCRWFTSPPTTNIFCRIWDYEQNIYKSYCSFENSGIINITRYDMENGIISGTFYCKAVSYDDPTDTIDIIKGRLDIEWSSVNFTSYP